MLKVSVSDCQMFLLYAMLLLAASAVAQDWSGSWKGTLVNFPARGASVEITREIGPLPAKEGECSLFRTTYAPSGKIPGMTKDYRLCRGKGTEDLFVDEGTSAPKLKARVLGDVLVSAFRVQKKYLLISHMRLRADGVLLEEIFSIQDGGETVTDAAGVESLQMTGIQRLEFRRVPAP